MGGKGTVLFIDDAPDILFISSIRIKKLGYEVLIASSGDEGIKMAEENKPGLIFLDIMMPEKNGIQVCGEIKRNPILKDVPVVLFTAAAESGVKESVEEAGAQDYLIKPFDPEALLEKVEKFLGDDD